ncbi:MAG: hypothetical protein WDM89_12220 [Rhizomicrobium sp.]
MKAIVTASVLLFAGTGMAFAGAGDEMASAVNGFYAAYATFHPSDGIPDERGRAKYEPYISPRLDALLKQGGDAEQKFAKANKDSPPLIEGDLFTSNFEGATSYTAGACSGDAKSGRCAVSFTYDPGNTGNPKDKSFVWTDTIYLVATSQGWRVDDISYGGTWDFGNKGKLSETLRNTIKDASQ